MPGVAIMADEFPAEGKFLIRFPLWVVVNKEKYAAKGFVPSLQVLRSPERPKFVPVFSEGELANRVIQELDYDGCGLVKLLVPEALRKLAHDCERIGVTHVCFDLDMRHGDHHHARGRLISVQNLLAEIPEDAT
jgi:hypothetical protein